ncbi:MAG TPA: hypothetical protein VGE69_07985 [Pseudomonadales bacterium]
MRPIEIVRSLPIAMLGSCLALLVSIGPARAADSGSPRGSAENQREPVEEIEVTGRRLLRLRAEIVGLEHRTFDMFNALNDTPEFKIHCTESIVTGSRIPERECVPVYMKRARMNEAQKFLFYDLVPPGGQNISGPPRNGGAISMNTRGAPQLTEEQLWFHNNHKHVAFNAKFRELAAQHPDLANLALELQAKRQQLLVSEARQRKDSAIGRFFSGFGSKDE